MRWRDRILQEDFRQLSTFSKPILAEPPHSLAKAVERRARCGDGAHLGGERELSLRDSIGASTISSVFRTAASTNPIPQVAQSRGREGSRATLPRRVQRLISRSSRSRA